MFKLSNNRKEAVRQLLQQYDAVLVFLKAHGCLLNAVKPEMLLEYEDFCRCAVRVCASLMARRRYQDACTRGVNSIPGGGQCKALMGRGDRNPVAILTREG